MVSLKSSLLSKDVAVLRLYEALQKIPSRPFTDWLNLPEDKEKIVPSIKKFVRDRKGSWDKIIVMGMGGSALGIVTLQKAFYPFDNRLTVLDNLDSNTINHHLSTLDPRRTLIIVISKSGTTLETMTQFEIFKAKYGKKLYQQNFIAITDPKEGELRKIVSRDKLASFPIPSQVGGRFSVLSAVGLLPFALLGGNMDQLLKGAAEMKKRCFQKTAKNPALQLAQITFDQKKPIVTFMSYDDQLYPLGFWYQQLLAESIGKSKKVGLTPVPLRGASDQHSVLQLLQDGPNDKLNIFLEVENPHLDVRVPGTTLTVHNILRAECNATEQALREDGRPTIMIEIPEISPGTLGELFMLFQMQIAILGELYGVNAFNQPGVEKSKTIVKKFLEQ